MSVFFKANGKKQYNNKETWLSTMQFLRKEIKEKWNSQFRSTKAAQSVAGKALVMIKA